MESEIKTEQKKEGYYINGRAQVVELLKFLPDAEKAKLLKSIRLRNPTLAMELSEESINFECIARISDDDIKQLLRYVSPTILGVALKGMDPGLQRRILSIPARSYAENAYTTMLTPINNESRDCKRAQNKVMQIINKLARDRKINII
ncbi:MAG: hypothetical protein HOE90_08235 [Bacteriovoracaceae bacterium]|jgi:flagellar motor switch protein FliG|nr:hypothetical protein [Bacteriovoracaceae bacterium]